jgi:transcriptional regulator
MVPFSPLPGTLDLLVLKAVSLGAEHGYGILLRIQRASRGALAVEQGALYPALFRLESQGFIAAEWGVSENNRKAKFYTLTRTGKARLAKDLGEWNGLVEAMAAVLGATRGELLA